MKRRNFLQMLTSGVLLSMVAGGCGSSNTIKVGTKLYGKNGDLWGTVVEVEEAHTFENGVVEPGMKVDYGPRMGNPPVPPQWMAQRAAERFTIK